MQFEIQPNVDRRPDGDTFTVARLFAADGARRRDLSHLIDRSYPYQSLRELRWHLAERFAVPVKGVEIRAA
ncbi:hypothetical protein [Salinarimonas ramus]|uniref:Uncharacterized protein n=1 Tax=Salinarimonas ramus TaxID=690164 RepID=A0A917V5T8_9HYPH|nr:hypothetical protein [Salinarimonas ramus]GGK44187.1 hypothetical protein GCM10011322_34140 [Salinarimonas ramus]